MKLSKAKQTIVDDARAAGYTIEEEETAIYIYKREKRWNKIKKGLVIYQSGTAFRMDVDPSVATGIRSHQDMRDNLGI